MRRRRNDSEYFERAPKLWIHPREEVVVIGVPVVNGSSVKDLYILDDGAEVPKDLEEFSRLDLEGLVRHVSEDLWFASSLKPLNFPDWQPTYQETECMEVVSFE